MINIQALEFHYRHGEFQLSVPEFSVLRSEKIAVIGPSGSGKTTLLNLIAGIMMPIKGSINVDSTCVNEMNDAGRRNFRIANMGFVFQDFELLNYLNVMDNILQEAREVDYTQGTEQAWLGMAPFLFLAGFILFAWGMWLGR